MMNEGAVITSEKGVARGNDHQRINSKGWVILEL